MGFSVGSFLGLRTWGTVLLSFFLLTPLLTQAADSDSANSIETLLNDAEGALLGRKRTSGTGKNSGSASTSAEKSKSPRSHSKAPVSQEVRRESEVPSAQKLNPIDTSGIQRVIALDLEASLREREPIYPIAVLSLSGGMHWLGNRYTLTKDDDVFSAVDGGRLQGAYLAFRPVWKVSWLESKSIGTFVSPLLGAGFSQGDIRVRRTGIQNNDRIYGMKLFPVDFGLQTTVEFAKTAGIIVGYGVGLEVLHQAGAGNSDSITDLFYGDQLWLGVSARISGTIEVMVAWKRKGTGLLFNNPAFGGQLLSAGVSFAFSS